MADRPIAQQHHETFEGIRQLDPDGNEFWLARQLAKVLDYSQYRHFLPVIERAKEACFNSGQPVIDHIEDVLTMVDIGSGARRQVEDFRLSRYACYLIVQNGDPGKSVIANGQTYFAMQTRRQELADDAKFRQLNEDEKRLAIRNELAARRLRRTAQLLRRWISPDPSCLYKPASAGFLLRQRNTINLYPNQYGQLLSGKWVVTIVIFLSELLIKSRAA